MNKAEDVTQCLTHIRPWFHPRPGGWGGGGRERERKKKEEEKRKEGRKYICVIEPCYSYLQFLSNIK